jgi:hypothetical protein
MNENSDQVTGLVKELLSLNDADSAPTDRSSERREEIEQRRSKPKRVRQELVLALSSWFGLPFVAKVRCLALVPL